MTVQLRTVAGIAIAGVVIGFAGLSAESAVASTTEDAFVAQIGTRGITYDSPQEVRDAAQLVCAQLVDGVSAHDVAAGILTKTDMTELQAAYFVAASVTFYCGDTSVVFTGYVG